MVDHPSPMVEAEELGLTPILLEDLVEDSPVIGWLSLLIPKVPKKVPLITGMSSIVSKVTGLEGRHSRTSILIKVEEKVFKLRLKKLNLYADKPSQVVHV